MCRHTDRAVADQFQDHRHVVRREAPEHVLLAAYRAEVEPVRLDPPQPAQPAPAHEVCQRPERRVVVQDVPDHQGEAAAQRGGREVARLPHLERDRLLDEHVLAGVERAARQRMVVRRLGDDRDRVDLAARQHLLEEEVAPAVPGDERLDRRLVVIDDRPERAELGEVAHEVAAPGAAADHGDARVRRMGATAHQQSPGRPSGLDDVVAASARPGRRRCGCRRRAGVRRRRRVVDRRRGRWRSGPRRSAQSARGVERRPSAGRRGRGCSRVGGITARCGSW